MRDVLLLNELFLHKKKLWFFFVKRYSRKQKKNVIPIEYSLKFCVKLPKKAVNQFVLARCFKTVLY